MLLHISYYIKIPSNPQGISFLWPISRILSHNAPLLSLWFGPYVAVIFWIQPLDLYLIITVRVNSFSGSVQDFETISVISILDAPLASLNIKLKFLLRVISYSNKITGFPILFFLSKKYLLHYLAVPLRPCVLLFYLLTL